MERIVGALERIRDHFATLTGGDDHWHPTCVITQVYTENRVPNRIPSHTDAVLDIRFPPPYRASEMFAAVERLARGVDCELILAAEPTHVAPDPLYLAATEEITGQAPTLIREHGGSDARYICQFGIPVIMTRPFVGNLHAENEWIDIASMETLYRIYERYLGKKLG
jgi:succinyl-diaminopimelate desuccinylase